MKRSRTYLGFGLAAVLALVAVAFFMADQSQTTSAAGGGPEMILTADGCTADCTFDLNEKFTLVADIVEGPGDPYVGAQTFIDYGPNLGYDLAAVSAGDEIQWADCSASLALHSQPNQSSEVVAHGCLTGLLPPLPPSTYEGPYLQISLTCSADNSTSDIRLVPNGDPIAPTFGTAFVLTDNVTQVVPKVGTLSVTCGAGPPADTPTNTPPPATSTPCPDGVCPTATPTPTATSTPTATPVPDTICGDVDRDGEVTGLDALWVLWFDAGLVDALLPFKDNNEDALPDLIGDINDDRSQNSVDAALILQIEAGLYSCA